MAKQSVKLSRWDAADYLRDEDDCLQYLDAVVQDADGNPQLIASALGDIARARGMMQVARDSGLAREALYRSLSPEGNPSLETVLKVARALGLEISFHKLSTRKKKTSVARKKGAAPKTTSRGPAPGRNRETAKQA